jgi:nitroreductase
MTHTQSLINQLYKEAGINVDNVPSNDFIDGILRRRSVREFNKVAVDDGTLKLLLAAAQSAPSSGRLQSWSVLVINDPDKKKHLVESNPCIGNIDGQNVNMVLNASPYLVWIADLHRNKTLLDSSNYSTSNIKQADLNLKAICDATIAAQTFCLAAESLGIGTCYMGTIREIPFEFWNTHYNVPEHCFPLFGTAIGYNQPQANKKFPRLPQDVLVHYNQYSNVNNVTGYNRTAFGLGSRFGRFEDLIAERVCRPSYTKEEIATSLKKAGFTFE